MWDESKHPRVPSGSPEGGQFATEAISILSLSDADGKRVIHPDGSMPSNNEIASYFTKNNRKLDLNDPEEYALVLKRMEAELGSQLKQPWSGIDFYDTDTREAMEIAAKEHPSLKGLNERIVFLAMSGVMSNQTAPPDQFEASLHFWEKYAASGFKEYSDRKDNGTRWGVQAKEMNLQALVMLVNKYGMKGAADFLVAEHTLDQLRSEKLSTGLYKGVAGIKGKALQVRSGFSMLGPKVGEYVRNMNGLSGVTIDLWATRTILRHIGDMTDKDGSIRNAPTSEKQRGIFKSLYTKAGEKYGLTPQKSQAGLWFFEQRLYRKLGKHKTGYSLAAGARRYRDRRLLRGGPSRGLESLSVPPRAAQMGARAPAISRPPSGWRE